MCENVQPKFEWASYFGGQEGGYGHIVASTAELAAQFLSRAHGAEQIETDLHAHGALEMRQVGPARCCYSGGCEEPVSFIDGTGNTFCCRHATIIQDEIDAKYPVPAGVEDEADYLATEREKSGDDDRYPWLLDEDE